MKNPLTILYLDDIKRGFYSNYDPNEGYEWEDFKIDFKKNTGYNFDDLKGGSYIKAKYLFGKHMSMVKNERNDNFRKFEEEKSTFYDTNGVLNEQKWQKFIESENKILEVMYQTDVLTSFKNDYNNSQRKITGQLDKRLTSIFSELETFQTHLQVYRDDDMKKLFILIVDYNPDCFDSADAIYRHGGKLYTISDRYWPKDKYREMEEVAKYFKIRKIENSTYFPDVIHKFPYAVGTEQWIKHYFNKLSKEELEKYKDYYFQVNFTIYSPITGFSGESSPDYFVNGKINWDC